MKVFDTKITSDEVKAYRDKHEVGLQVAHRELIRERMIKHLQDGGASEPVLLYLLEHDSLYRICD